MENKIPFIIETDTETERAKLYISKELLAMRKRSRLLIKKNPYAGKIVRVFKSRLELDAFMLKLIPKPH